VSYNPKAISRAHANKRGTFRCVADAAAPGKWKAPQIRRAEKNIRVAK